MDFIDEKSYWHENNKISVYEGFCTKRTISEIFLFACNLCDD